MKKRVLICLSILLIAATTVACGGKNNNKTEAPAEEVSKEDAGEATSEAAEEADSESSEDPEFYFTKLKKNEELRMDLGSDGKMDTISFKKKTTQIFKIFIDHNHGGRWPLQPLANLKLWGMDPRPPHQACGLQTPLVPAQVKSHHRVLSSGVTESVSRSAVSDSLWPRGL